MIKAVIFDLDGVLADTEVFSGDANNSVLREFGIELTPEERRNALGRRDLDCFAEYIRRRNLSLDPKEILRRKVQIYSKLINGKLKPMPGAKELIEKLRNRGIPFALASSGEPEKIRATLNEIGFDRIFNIIVSGEDIGKGKPNPEIFLRAAEKLGFKPEECLVVEDSQAGIEAAKRAGMKCLALKNPNTYGQDLSGADRVIHSLKKVEEEL